MCKTYFFKETLTKLMKSLKQRFDTCVKKTPSLLGRLQIQIGPNTNFLSNVLLRIRKSLSKTLLACLRIDAKQCLVNVFAPM
jgi:hypothetical protein